MHRLSVSLELHLYSTISMEVSERLADLLIIHHEALRLPRLLQTEREMFH